MGHDLIVRAIREATGLELAAGDIVAAVRRSYLRGLALELRQGFTDEEYTVPAQVMASPNPHVTLPHFITEEFLVHFKHKVWSIFLPEMEGLLPDGDVSQGT
jgi:aldehyde:ferredoxin oxidoreductase